MAIKAEPKGRLLVDVFKDEMAKEGEQVSSSTSGDSVLVLVLSGEAAEKVRRASLSMGLSEADVVTMAIESYEFRCN